MMLCTNNQIWVTNFQLPLRKTLRLLCLLLPISLVICFSMLDIDKRVFESLNVFILPCFIFHRLSVNLPRKARAKLWGTPTCGKQITSERALEYEKWTVSRGLMVYNLYLKTGGHSYLYMSTENAVLRTSGPVIRCISSNKSRRKDDEFASSSDCPFCLLFSEPRLSPSKKVVCIMHRN